MERVRNRYNAWAGIRKRQECGVLAALGRHTYLAGYRHHGLLEHRSRPRRQGARRLRDRTFGFRLEEVPRTNPTVWFYSFRDPDQSVVRKGGIDREEQQETREEQQETCKRKS